MKKLVLTVCALVFCLSLTALAQQKDYSKIVGNIVIEEIPTGVGGTTWAAIAPGETLADFETPVCPGALSTITGDLPGDRAHLYCINVTASEFLATTTGTAGTLDDTM